MIPLHLRVSSFNISGLGWPAREPGRLFHLDQWKNLLFQGIKILAILSLWQVGPWLPQAAGQGLQWDPHECGRSDGLARE